jgi:hypothetical protein
MSPSHTRRSRPIQTLGSRSLSIAAACLLLFTGSAASEPNPDLVALDRALVEVRVLLAEAHFLTTIGVAKSTSRWARELPASEGLLARRAQLQVLIATAQVALSRDDRARESLRLAVELDPKLVLAEPTTSPKLVRVFRQLQRRAPRAGGRLQ